MYSNYEDISNKIVDRVQLSNYRIMHQFFKLKILATTTENIKRGNTYPRVLVAFW